MGETLLPVQKLLGETNIGFLMPQKPYHIPSLGKAEREDSVQYLLSERTSEPPEMWT